MRNTKSYESPFCTRYASEEMQYVFSADKKFSTWRRLWVALARAEMNLGLPVTKEQVEELEANIDNIDYDVAEARERLFATMLCPTFMHTDRFARTQRESFTWVQHPAMSAIIRILSLCGMLWKSCAAR